MRMSLLGLVLASGLAHAEPFVFQGTLNDGSAPAEGAYDFEFLLFDSESGGSQVGITDGVEDISVSNGAFNVELDFGDGTFNGSERWVEIRVRDGDSTGAYTLLSPRAKIGNAPQAGFAIRSGVAEAISDQFWTNHAPGVIYFGDNQGDGKFLINRDTPIESTDTFVVHTAASNLAGMTLSGWENTMPYYGYATGGFSRVKTYYDPATDAWVVSKGGDQLEIDANNDVVITNNLIVGGTITALGGGGSGGTMVGYESHTPETIFAGFGQTLNYNSVAGAIQNEGSGSYLRFVPELPHGATITNIRVQYVDGASGTNLRLELWTRDVTTLEFSNEVLATSTGSTPSTVQLFDFNPEIVIDKTDSTYSFRAFATSGSWPSPGLLGIRSVVIEYEVPLP